MATNHDIVNGIEKSYAMELETVENYLANSNAAKAKRLTAVAA